VKASTLAFNWRREGAIDDAQGGKAVVLEVEGEGLEDERGGVAGIEGDGTVGLGDVRAGEPAGGLGGRGTHGAEELSFGNHVEVTVTSSAGAYAGIQDLWQYVPPLCCGKASYLLRVAWFWFVGFWLSDPWGF
jgi:hypothetical protein